ncbi:MAG TPA: hypothetical protein VH207_13510 [Chthoniobacterales bacterium]|jgi:hypothetical protein|nr:hypothetical protein [Chthoniobacterales bacterium]
MPYTTELTEDYQGIIQIGNGIVTGSEILQGCRSVTALVQTTENFHYKLVDFTSARELQITERELAEIVEEDRLIARARPHAAVAIVAPNDEMAAIAHHWETLVEELGWSTHVAPTRAEALEWLREKLITAQVEF